MTERAHGTSVPQEPARTVSRETFLREPSSVLSQARAHGAIAITDASGRTLLRVCVPTDVHPDRDD
jgi:hypothetical protein